MIHHGVFATAEEIAYVKSCASAPVMAFTNPESPGPGVSPVIPFAEDPLIACHRLALAHGLPEIKGYYGMDLRNGQFVSYED